jgi:3-deoxy-7-phosphoheptulonate synthase
MAQIQSGAELNRQMPITARMGAFISSARATIDAILEGDDNRILLIVGPCSIHDEKATYEFAKKLKKLSLEVSSTFFIVMRTYFEKPRTKKGWKGLIYDPDLDGSHNIHKGIVLTRKILMDLTAEEIPLGCELLELATFHYFSDLLSWGCIGARTCASQPHRQLASTLPFPIGFKNSTDGNVENALNGILSAKAAHTFLGVNSHGVLDRIKTEGNRFCHLVLRGGENGPNFDSLSIQNALEKCAEKEIRQKVLVDCSHDNSQKKEKLQILAFESVLKQIEEGNRNIFGMMLESNLFSGSQPLAFPLKYGVSITDPCLDWETTKDLILNAAERLASLICV